MNRKAISGATRSTAQLTGRSWENCGAGTEYVPFVVPGVPEANFLMWTVTGANTGGYWDLAGCTRLVPANNNGQGEPRVSVGPESTAIQRAWVEQRAVFD